MNGIQVFNAIAALDDALVERCCPKADVEENRTAFFRDAAKRFYRKIRIRAFSVAVGFLILIGAISVWALPRLKGGEDLSRPDPTRFQITYGSDRNIVYEKTEDIAAQLDDFFNVKGGKGAIARIVPQGYRFFWIVKKDDLSDSFYVDGFAECVCRVDSVSTRHNTLALAGGDVVTVRQNIHLMPKTEDEAFVTMITEIGAFRDGTPREGTFQIPERYINETDFGFLIHDLFGILYAGEAYDVMLGQSALSGQPDCLFFRYLCPVSEERLTACRWEPDIVFCAENFRTYLTENEPDILSRPS